MKHASAYVLIKVPSHLSKKEERVKEWMDVAVSGTVMCVTFI